MRVLSVMMCLCATVLAGCSDQPDDTTVADDDPCLVESADDYTCAQMDGNKTADQVAHLHNYWGGKETVRLLEETAPLGAPVYSSCDAYPIRAWLPPDDATVYQGTGLVDVTTRVTYEPDHASGPLEIWVKRADQDAPGYVADLEDGATVTMQINHSAADLPHQQLSAWEFWVYAQPDPRVSAVQCMVLPRATVTFEVDIHKTLEIQPFPGHPDHWRDGDQRALLDAFANFRYTEEWLGSCTTGGGGSSHPDGSCQMHWSGFGPLNGSIVPPGGDAVHLTLTASPADGQPETEFGLRYHGADTRTFEPVEPVSRQGNVAEYEIPVGADSDGPYAEQSQWRFQVVNESDHGAYQGGWSLQGTVLREQA